MKINDIIRQRRTAMHLTQEQVANALGVTAPAVHKWEKGTSYPDITLLPALARLLDTDLNTLLSFQADLSNQEITLFLNQLTAQLDTEGLEAAYQTATKKIWEYPTCYTLILNVALVLDGALSMQGEVNKQYETEIEALYTRALDSTDPAIQNQAKCMLISKRMKEQNYTAAQELLQTLSDPDSTDKQQMQANLFLAQGQLDQAAKIEEEKLLSTTNELHQILISLMEIAWKDGRMEDAEYIANVSKQEAILFDLWEYNSYVAHFQLYSASKNRLKCLKVLLPMLKSLTHRWDINASPLYRHIKAKPAEQSFGPKMQKTILSSLRTDPDAAFLQDSPELQALEHELDPNH